MADCVDRLTRFAFEEAARVPLGEPMMLSIKSPIAGGPEMDSIQERIGKPIPPETRSILGSIGAGLCLRAGVTKIDIEWADLLRDTDQGMLSHGFAMLGPAEDDSHAIALNLSTPGEWEVWLVSKVGNPLRRVAPNLGEFVKALTSTAKRKSTVERQASERAVCRHSWVHNLKRLHDFGAKIGVFVDASATEDEVEELHSARCPGGVVHLLQSVSRALMVTWKLRDGSDPWLLPGGVVPTDMRRTNPCGFGGWSIDQVLSLPERSSTDGHVLLGSARAREWSTRLKVALTCAITSPKWEVWCALGPLHLRLAPSLAEWFQANTSLGFLKNPAYLFDLYSRTEDQIDLDGPAARKWRSLLGIESADGIITS